MRFDAFPNNPASGSIQFYAQDVNWGWNDIQVQISSFQVGVWKQLTLALPTTGRDWSGIQDWGIRVIPGGTCQPAKLYIDSFQMQ
jgi:hypothetical protein